NGARRVVVYDTTLRDGAQGSGVSFSVSDKLSISRALDRIGVDYVEGGFPGSNPKDEEFFAAMAGVPLKRARLAAFGATRRAGGTARVGIHTHNDCELAVANTLEGVAAGAEMVQGTINGYGERCGNANLISVVANLVLKQGVEAMPAGSVSRFTELARTVAEI